ncbi:MAG: hypothetical protein WA681_14195, partial [Candidatus Acidiferrales bacterium]
PKKLQTTLYIVAAILACGVVGTVIGLAPMNPNAAGILGAFFVEIGGIAVLRFIAIRRSSKKFQTAFYIGTVILACGLVGTLIRLAFVNSHAAGTLAAFFMQIGGIAVSIEQIRRYRRVGLT